MRRRSRRRPALWTRAERALEASLAPQPPPRTIEDEIRDARAAWEHQQKLRYDVLPGWYRDPIQRHAQFRAEHPHLFPDRGGAPVAAVEAAA